MIISLRVYERTCSMADLLDHFEWLCRRAFRSSHQSSERKAAEHSFEDRNIHPELPEKVRSLFDDGHFSQATFEAFKFLDKEVQRLSGLSETGEKLMMKVFQENAPIIKLNQLSSVSEVDEQRGYKFLFSGAIVAIRNPRGHEYKIVDDPETCLDHLSVVSTLLRKLDAVGFSIGK